MVNSVVILLVVCQLSRDVIGYESLHVIGAFQLQFMFEVSSVWPHSKEQELTEMQISGPVSVEEQLNLIPI